MNLKKETSYHTKIEIVSNRIRDSILNGDLKPQDRILIKSIAESLGFSTIPVREGIRKLEVEGFLEIKPHKGVYVREPDSNELSDIFEVRILLECRAAKLAVEKIRDSHIVKLRAINREMDSFAKQSDRSSILKYFRLNRKFHGKLYKCAGNSFLCKTIERIALNIEPHLLRYISSAASRKIAQEDHEKILRACEEKDAKLVEQLIAGHLRNILSIILKLTPQPVSDEADMSQG